MSKVFNMVFVLALLLAEASALRGQTAENENRSLPIGTVVVDNGPRDYRFEVDYITSNTQGETIHRQRVVGDYTRGLPDNTASWKNVTVSEAIGAEAEYGPADRRAYMDEFRYSNKLDVTMQPDFFSAFPPTAVVERNLVWDTGMFEFFGQEFFDELKLNTPHHILSNQDVNMPNLGTFQNRDVVLEWISDSLRNEEDCALIQYEAFLNRLNVDAGGIHLQGRSDYWGLIWVSKKTKQIEYATLRETVVAEMKLPGQNDMQVINVFRNGTFVPIKE